jgi:hypothetical protein
LTISQMLIKLFAFNNNCILKLMSFKLSLLGVDYAKEKNRDGGKVQICTLNLQKRI